jgi:hypothetical protein
MCVSFLHALLACAFVLRVRCIYFWFLLLLGMRENAGENIKSEKKMIWEGVLWLGGPCKEREMMPNYICMISGITPTRAPRWSAQMFAHKTHAGGFYCKFHDLAAFSSTIQWVLGLSVLQTYCIEHRNITHTERFIPEEMYCERRLRSSGVIPLE